LLDLFDRDSQHRDVRVNHGTANRLTVSVETVAADRPVRVQLGERDPRAELSLGEALAPRDPASLVTTTAGEPVTLRVHLVHPVESRTLLGVQLRRLALE